MASVAKVTLPLPGIEASLKELERVIDAPGVVGITIGPDLAESRGTVRSFQEIAAHNRDSVKRVAATVRQ